MSQTFLINVAVREGRDYAWLNMDSAVIVKVNDMKKCSQMHERSDCPFYNEYFVFEFQTSLEKLLEHNITITVIRPRSCFRKRKTLGFVNMDVATVWEQPSHQFYHKWAILSAPFSDVISGPRGYLKLDIFIISKGQVPTFPTNVINDEIQGNLLLPEGVYSERQKARFHFDIYRIQNLISDHVASTSSTYVQIKFAGLTVKTACKRSDLYPDFNERLSIIELFPPLCQRIRIEVYHGDSIRKPLHSFHIINLRLISNDKDEGFLPTFGPAFLHLYSLHNFQGYVGSILMAINTEIHEDLMIESGNKKTETSLMPPLDKNVLCEYIDTVLMVAIFEVTAIDAKYSDKPVSFKLSFGHQSSHRNNESEAFCTTVPQKPTKMSRNKFCYLIYGEEKPCLRIQSTLPDFRKRMYNSNMLTKIYKDLVADSNLKLIKTMLVNGNYNLTKSEFCNLSRESVDNLAAACKIYVDLLSSYNFKHGTLLDVERQKMCLKEITEIIKKCEKFDCRSNQMKTFGKMEKMCSTIENLIKDEQSCWPDIFLWMYSGNKKVAFIRLFPQDIIYSKVDEENGLHCSNLRTMYFQTKESSAFENKITAKIDLKSWLGLERHQSDCHKSILDEGFSYDLESKFIISQEKFTFEARAHFYQARLNPGSDKSGLADPFLQIVIANQFNATKILKNTLNPIWDETLILKGISLYGSKSFIKSNSPIIIVEIWDRDQIGVNEFVGRCEMRPVIKFKEQPYTLPDFPPKLKWVQMFDKQGCVAELLAAIELLEVTNVDEEMRSGDVALSIPADIKPKLAKYKFEVVFWGVRDLKKIHLIQINKPRISVYCGDLLVNSDTIVSAKKNSNFSNPQKTVEVVLSIPETYAPPVNLKIFDSRSFGVFVYCGVYISSILPFLYRPLTKEERELKIGEGNVVTLSNSTLSKESSMSNSNNDNKLKALQKIRTLAKIDDKTTSEKKRKETRTFNCLTSFFHRQKESKETRSENNSCLKGKKANRYDDDVDDKRTTRKKWPLFKYVFGDDRQKKKELEAVAAAETEYLEEEYNDWWTKFYASKNIHSSTAEGIESKYKLKIYQSELEFQPEFKGFTDVLTTFEMYKGKRTGDETVDEENITAVFKGALKIYRWPPSLDDKDYVTVSGLLVKDGIFRDFPPNTPMKYILRVYCVRGLGLRPKDLDGKSDPYLRLTLSDRVVNDRDNYIKRQVNPSFGRCFEFEAVFPRDHALTIAVWDRDVASKDDLIGQTRIDLEKRFYTKHRAFCGMAFLYEEKGFCAWRDRLKPSEILESLCKKYTLPDPEYGAASVNIGANYFASPDFLATGDSNYDKQVLALTALHRWNEIPLAGFSLVPEHVETRSLFNPASPGIEQGKLQIWIDIFHSGTDLLPKPKTDISPRKPKGYELRVIIWNAEDVILSEDDFFVDEKKSDIYVQGWLTDSDDVQCTDVHYRSLTGEGNFNWRFIFRFDYLPSERRILIRKKDTMFALHESESKIPAKLTLQIWDNDTFSADDFIGTLSMELCHMPRGSKNSKKCSIGMLEPQAPSINLFRIKRTKGWWPITSYDPIKKTKHITGKLEVELEIFTQEEADLSPAGLGRNDPQKLPPPKRPETSFAWFKNPLRTLNYVACKLHRWKLIKAFLFILLVVFLVIAIYAFPGYTVKRLLGA